MKLFEYEAKTILKKNGVPTPNGELAISPSQAKEIAVKINRPLAVKAQVLVAGRGKAGGIMFSSSPEEAEQASQKLLGMNLKGIVVQAVWLEEKISAKKELYFSVAVDRANRCYVVMASTEGGVDIEEVAAQSPEKIVRLYVDPDYGFRLYNARQIAQKLGYNGNQMLDLASVFYRFFQMAVEQDAELAEMNPLIEKSDGKFVAADARIIIDDNALYRHPDFMKRPFEEAELTPQEQEAEKAGLAYVKLDGDIGIIGNGAGLVMATLDAIQLHGGRPANFLDVGGGATADVNAVALKIVLSDPNVKVVFINILGGITRCDEVAKGILEAKTRFAFNKPMVIRLVGTNEEVGRRLLTDAGIHVLGSMEEAASKAVELVKTGGML